jgi:hypothetical protein
MKKLGLLLLLLACDTHGTNGGLPFTPNTELASIGPLPDGGVDPRFVVIAIAAINGGAVDCAAWADGGTRTGQALGITLGRLDGTPFAAGTYPIVSNVTDLDAGVGADLALVDDTGHVIAVGTGGTVNLTSVGSTYVGNYNAEAALTAGGNTTYAGDFSATLCAQ